MSSLQMSLPDSEPTIAGKTHSEILSMDGTPRYQWYKTISLDEKEEAMRIVETARRAKLSAASMGENNPSKRPEVRAKISASMAGENNPNYGKTFTHTEETKAKISASMAGENNPNFGKSLSKETRAKLSAASMGENNHSFNNWSSREPYCPLWDEPLRERCRNHYGRVCVLSDTLRSVMGSESGLDDFAGHEIFSGRRLSVHHIRGDKMEGCNGTELALIPLQGGFNSKKFDGLRLEDHPFYITLFLLKDIERKHRTYSQ